MDDFLDVLWLKIVALVHHVRALLEILFSPLNALGPAFAISTIAFLAVALSKYLTKTFKTKRYLELQKEFEYWHNLRQEALKCEDPEKAKLLAKNIDQAKLNKAYYDYFFEGFLIGLMTKFLPLMVFMAYVNEVYKPNNMIKLFGREYVFKFTSFNGEAIFVGAVFWYVVSIVLAYVVWSIVKKIWSKYAFPSSNETSLP